jgi:hypothetical protein
MRRKGHKAGFRLSLLALLGRTIGCEWHDMLNLKLPVLVMFLRRGVKGPGSNIFERNYIDPGPPRPL